MEREIFLASFIFKFQKIVAGRMARTISMSMFQAGGAVSIHAIMFRQWLTCQEVVEIRLNARVPA